MNHVITTYGGGELFNLVFSGIAALFKTDRTGILLPLMRVGLMTGLFYVLILMLFRNQVAEGFKWFLWVIIATNLIFLPKTTLFIHDPLTKAQYKVDHVPFALAAFAGLTSNIGRAITEQFEAVFTLPDYMPYHQTGTVFASSLMKQVGQFRIVDPVFKGNMERFVNQCVVYDAMIGHKYTLTDLQNTRDIWQLVTTNASPVLGFLYKAEPGSTPGQVVTCREGATALNRLWQRELDKAIATYGSSIQNQKLTKAAFSTHLQNGFQLLSGITESAQNILRQEMMINAIEESSNNKLSELGATSNYAATKALLQQRSTYAIAGEIAARTLPLFKNVIEALSYALFIFIVVLALLPNGYRILLTYGGILVWTQLWAPLYAVLNLIMTLYGKSETISLGAQNGLTLLNSSAIVNVNADTTTLAAWLSVSIPFISYGILKQGAAAFVGLAHHLSSGMQSAASSSAAETVSGNISLGNLSMGTQSYQNTSAFQHNTSPSYTASQFRALSSQGIEKSSFADGTQSFSDQALSRMSVQIMGTENTSYAQQHNLSEAQNVVRSQSIAAGHAIDAATQSTTNFLSQVGKAISSGTDRNQSVSASEAKTLQDFKNYAKDIQQNTGMTETQAMEAAVGASSGALQLLGIDIKGGFSSAAARQKAIQAADSVAKQTNYSDNLDKVISAAQSFSESHNETGMKDLGKGVTSSLNKAKSLRDEVSVAQNQVNTLSNDISASQGKSLSINKDLTQSVLEFIAHQPINPGPHLMGPNGESQGQIGYEGARHILENGGPEREAYITRFQEENPQYHVQGINSAQEKRNLAEKFESGSNEVKASSGVMEQHAQNTEHVLAQAKETNLDLTKVPESREKEITGSLNAQDKLIHTGKVGIDKAEKGLQEAEKGSKEKNMTGSVLKNAHASLMPDELLVLQDLAIKSPSVSQFASALQKQKAAQGSVELSSDPSPRGIPFEKESPSPPSAFTAFKTRLETDSKGYQVTQSPQNISSTVISSHKKEMPPPSNEKMLPAEKMPIPMNATPGSLVAQATPSSSIESPRSYSSTKVEKLPDHRAQISQQHQETQKNPEQKKEDSLQPPKVPLPSEKIRK